MHNITAQHRGCITSQHSTAQHSTAKRSIAQCSPGQSSTAQHSAAQHSTAQRSAAQHLWLSLHGPFYDLSIPNALAVHRQRGALSIIELCILETVLLQNRGCFPTARCGLQAYCVRAQFNVQACCVSAQFSVQVSWATAGLCAQAGIEVDDYIPSFMGSFCGRWQA